MIICGECNYQDKHIDAFNVEFQQLEIDPDKVREASMSEIRELAEFSSRLVFSCPYCNEVFDFRLGTDHVIVLRKENK